jgi:alpha-N-arabinofuranosidase
VNVSASKDEAGKIHVTFCNLNPAVGAEVSCELQGASVKQVSGRLLTAPEITAHNTFDHPDQVKTSEFSGAKATDTGFSVTLPAKSVVALEIQ